MGEWVGRPHAPKLVGNYGSAWSSYAKSSFNEHTNVNSSQTGLIARVLRMTAWMKWGDGGGPFNFRVDNEGPENMGAC